MPIEADPEVCVGSGMCALTAPGLFDQSQDDGTVVVLRPVPADPELDDVRDAVRRCPSGALKLTD
ncbi:ferredoxin [Actinacidiphila bryophytorum]|nr:(4Fe-4S)-binding protein [Actinacidiphila bryophytorum]MBM9438323.1 (4Fe-4S)-binding protein [Actinacidiphila bryophytorum]MBN6542652.1 (4Fe-4S)-binding protein [Actinacidiphila bryophytorum]